MSDPVPAPSPALKTPALTVIVPTFNRADVLIACLQHLEKQCFADFEVILVDDGSTDSTPQLLADYAAKTILDLRTIRQPNSGAAAARNLAVRLARSPVCVFIGDDILAAPTFLGHHYGFHQDNPSSNAAALGLTVWSETGQTVTPFMRWMENGFQFDYPALLSGAPADWHYFYTSNVSAKTDLLRRNPFDERFRLAFEDTELGYRLTQLENLKMTFLPEALAEHVHPSDFGRACRRAFEAGRGYVLFESLWPEAATYKSPLRLALRDFLGRMETVLPPLVWMTDKLTRVWCPNPLIRPVLAMKAAAGRRKPLS